MWQSGSIVTLIAPLVTIPDGGTATRAIPGTISKFRIFTTVTAIVRRETTRRLEGSMGSMLLQLATETVVPVTRIVGSVSGLTMIVTCAETWLFWLITRSLVRRLFLGETTPKSQARSIAENAGSSEPATPPNRV